MGFFDFLGELPGYGEDDMAVLRLNKRHAMLISPFVAQLNGARVLDLGAHDGRWAYALAAAGAAEVVAVEGRQAAVDQFARFPDTPFKSRVQMRCADLWQALEAEVAAGAQYDVVALFGIFYHVMDHVRLLQLIKRLGAPLVLIDSEFALAKGSNITLVMEDTAKPTNATPQVAGQARAIVGIPSFLAMERMAQALGYDCHWYDDNQLAINDMKGLGDYFRTERKRRAFCHLVARD
ncbi:methyltransferase domain-containing protein [uncultured Tateyamaria sp.]|uniref:methyltransferase domain-containing protein n=1 Tax=Tateyamaria sp. 1078 TaxID=3417464 RepID=UPI002610D6A8|nr:methyltransferase domain-containing protein [uncultured Tateyamaria sp.]